MFRNSFLDVIPKDPSDVDKYILTLELNDQKLDYKRYAEPLFELLIVGGLIAPGGIISTGVEPNPFSLFSRPSTKDDMKQQVVIINRLVRRHKYLQPRLFETMSHLLQYINKFVDSWEKLAGFTALLIISQLVPISILNNLTKEHLVKDGASLQFVTHVFRVYLEEQPMEHLGIMLKKCSMDDKLLEFFPLNKRDNEYLARQFETEGLKSLVDYYQKRQQSIVKDDVKNKLRAMFSEGSFNQMIQYMLTQASENSWNDSEVVAIIWDALAMSIEWSNRPEQFESQVTKLISSAAPLLRNFTHTPKAELSFLHKVQIVCYEDVRFMKLFSPIVCALYDNDIISGGAIIYWYEKGYLSQGKSMFLRQLEKFVAQLKETSSNDEDDNDSE